MDIQWYPGHMKKALRQMKEDAKLIDLVIELTDARAPLAARNPDFDEVFGQKARILVLNKADLADPAQTKRWMAYFEESGVSAVEADARKQTFPKEIRPLIERLMRSKRERDARRGIVKTRPLRTMVVGIPNSGKSTFINTYAKRAATRTGNKPGVTKGKQWIRLGKDLELLDTPGVLVPKFETKEQGMYLACIGSVRDEVVRSEELAAHLMEMLDTSYPAAIADMYGVQEKEGSAEILNGIAHKRGCMKSGGEPDTLRAAHLFLEDFRAGKLGRITLEQVKGNETSYE